jgi:hypothetical protein
MIGTDVDALLFAREDFTPAFERTTALAVEEIFGTLRLGTEKGHLQKRAVSAAAAARTDELDPIFQLYHRPFHLGSIDLLEEPSSWPVKRSLRRKGQVVKEPHDSMTEGLSGLASFTNENICIQACLWILLKKIKAISLRKGEFTSPFLPVGGKFLRFLDDPLHIFIP